MIKLVENLKPLNVNKICYENFEGGGGQRRAALDSFVSVLTLFFSRTPTQVKVYTVKNKSTTNFIINNTLTIALQQKTRL